jgi:hypothetical protein
MLSDEARRDPLIGGHLRHFGNLPLQRPEADVIQRALDLPRWRCLQLLGEFERGGTKGPQEAGERVPSGSSRLNQRISMLWILY